MFSCRPIFPLRLLQSGFGSAKEIKRKNPAKAKAMLVRSLDMRPSKDTASVLLSLLIKLGDMKEAKVLIDAQSKEKRPGRICSVRASSGSGEQLGLRCLSPRMEMTIGQLALTSRSSGTGIAARRSPSSPKAEMPSYTPHY